MEKVINYLIRVLLPKRILLHRDTVMSLQGKIEELKRQSFEQRKHIRYLEEQLATKYSLPRNFKEAVDNVNSLSPKARATFLFTLVNGITTEDDTLETLCKYVDLRTKGDRL